MDDSLKHVPLCEELVAITDDIKEALVLRQMLYWVPRMHDTDAYIKEERSHLADEDEAAITLTHGWVHKTGEDIASETMIGSGKTGRRRLASLVEKDYLEERERQNSDWDRTREYRPNVAAIQDDLQSEGYDLQTVVGKDWPVFESLFKLSGRSGQADDSGNQTDDSGEQVADSAPAHNAPTRSETTTETTTESEPRTREEMSDTIINVLRDVGTLTSRLESKAIQLAHELEGEYDPRIVANALREDLGGTLRAWNPNVFKDNVLPRYMEQLVDSKPKNQQEVRGGGQKVDHKPDNPKASMR